MADKLYGPREAALAVLEKAKELLANSELSKSEKLKKDGNTLGSVIGYPGAAQTAPVNKKELKKYETENKKEPSDPPKDKSKGLERDYEDYEVKSGKSKSSDSKRQEKQKSPSKNPKEEAEGNNKPYGSEPKDEFKKHECPHCGKMHKSEEFTELCSDLNSLAKENFESLEKSEKAKKLADKVESGKEGLKEALHDANKPKKVLKELRNMDKHGLSAEEIKARLKKAEMEKHGLSPEEIKAKMKKAESKHDRCVEHVKENSPEVKNPHAVCVAEGVKPAKWGKEEMANPSVFVPAKIVGSAKLSKFMERMHAKRKARAAQGEESQSPEAVGKPEMKSEAMEKKYEGFKAVEESARESGAKDPAAVAAAVGRKKYGKEAFQHAAAKGHKMGKK